MTDQADHPTAGRRRRHKSPASIPPAHDLPLPRLLDHMGAEDGPSCSEEEKDAKRQRSESTMPRSTMGTLPYEYDRVMGVASVDSHKSVRSGEGDDPEPMNSLDTVAHHREEEVSNDQEKEVGRCDVTSVVGESHGRFGSASFRECLNLAAQSESIYQKPLCSLPL